MDVPVHFICGMSRAGTRWMSMRLNEHPDAVVFGETCFWGRKYREPDQDGRYGRVASSQLHHEFVGDAFGMMRSRGKNAYRYIDHLAPEAVLNPPIEVGSTPADVFQTYANRIAAAEHAKVAIEKTPHHLLFVDRIATALPNAKFLVMVRDPYDFMLSYKHQGDRKPEAVKRNFDALYHPASCAILWRGYARAVRAATSKHGQRLLVVPFSRIGEQPQALLEDVCEFLDLDPVRVPDVPTQKENTSFPDGERPRLDAADETWMGLIAGREMAALGFERRPLRPVSVATIRSAARTPAWAARNVLHMHRSTRGSTLKYLRRWLR